MCSIFCITDRSVSPEAAKDAFMKTVSRGPDQSRFIAVGRGYMGFHRLAIMGLDERGMQPFTLGKSFAVCNGELYGWHTRRRAL
ncbi:MAG: asparagine synthetase B, partial [Christensenellaceae bacterium]